MKLTARSKSLLLSVLFALALCGITFTVWALADKLTIDFESRKYHSLFFAILSYAFVIVASAVCILLRKFKKVIALRGIVFYLLIGLISFVIYFMLLLADEQTFLTSLTSEIYYLWTLPLHEGALLAISAFHFPVTYVMALFYAFITYVAAKSLHGIKIDREFEKRIKEKHDLEKQAAEESLQEHVQTAKQAEDRVKNQINP